MNGISVYDNPGYVERRARQADEAEARVDAIVAQAARRHAAIDVAVRRVRGVQALNKQGTITRDMLEELLGEIAGDLEIANKVRATDEGNNGK